MSSPAFHVAAPPRADPESLAEQFRRHAGASVATNPRLDPTRVDPAALDAVIVAGGELEAPDVLAAAKSVPAAAFADGSLHPGMRECGLGDATVLLTDRKRRTAIDATAQLLLESDPPYRTTLIRPDGGAEWRTEYGATAVTVPDGEVLVSAADVPGWASRPDVEVVVADASGSVIGSGRARSIDPYPPANTVPATLVYPIL